MSGRKARKSFKGSKTMSLEDAAAALSIGETQILDVPTENGPARIEVKVADSITLNESSTDVPSLNSKLTLDDKFPISIESSIATADNILSVTVKTEVADYELESVSSPSANFKNMSSDKSHTSSPTASSSSKIKAAKNPAVAAARARLKDSLFEEFKIETGQKNIDDSDNPTVVYSEPSGPRYNERGIHIETELDLCDCGVVKCPGCWNKCPNCKSNKCGPTCRVNRSWEYEEYRVEGENTVYKNIFYMRK